MEGGFIITSRQADAYSKDQPMTMKLRWNDSATMREKIFFSLYRNEGITYVIAELGEDLSEFIDTGVLKDLRSKGVIVESTGASFYTFVKSLQYDDRERIRRCNELRDVIYSKMKIRVRSCGPELESLLRRNIYQRCHEMVGMYDQGTYMSMDGITHEKKYERRVDENLNDFKFCELTYDDLGQKKLYSVFDGFVMARNVIYVGSSPGLSWLDLLSKYPDIIVYSFDPRPLARTHPRVRHFQIEVKNVSHILDNLDLSKKYDLIWDVRGDFIDHESYELMVKTEINLLNDIINLAIGNLVRINVKIRIMSLDRYLLYGKGRFFMMPYTIERNKNELRYVARVGQVSHFSAQICSSLRIWMDKVHQDFSALSAKCSIESLFDLMSSSNYVYSNFNLFLNSKLMRLDVMDYVVESRLDSDIDVNLFSINCNSPLKMVEYFDKSFPVVCSYFSKKYLNEAEFPLIDFDCLDFLKYSVYDSRIFIHKLIPGIHVIIPKNIKLMQNELLTSESFRLQQSYDLILNRFSNSDYVKAKSLAASEEGSLYRKFPESFSIMDDMISVSGHMMRFGYLCLVEDSVSFLTYCDKILHNFFLNNGLHKEKANTIINGGVNWFYFGVGKCLIERKSNQFWHSAIEWRTGIRALKFLLPEKFHSDINKMIVRFDQLLSFYVDTEKKGYELYDFLCVNGVLRLKQLKTFRGFSLSDDKTVFRLISESFSHSTTNNFGLNFLTPILGKAVSIDLLAVRNFKIDVAVRFLHIILCHVSIISHVHVTDVWKFYAEIFDWKRLIYLSNLLFDRRMNMSVLWSEEDLKEISSYELFPLFSYEWDKFDASWDNRYYYLIRMLIYLRETVTFDKREKEPIALHWRRTYDTNWLTKALELGLRPSYIDSLILCEEEMNDFLYSLSYDAENLYRKVMKGLINATP